MAHVRGNGNLHAVDDLDAARVLPHNLEAERSVLGASLLNREAFALAADLLEPGGGEYFRDAHQRTWRSMERVTARGGALDLVSLKDDLAGTRELDTVGGPAYLATLVDAVPRSMNVESYARIVKEKARLRRLISAAKRIEGHAYDGEIDATALQQAECLIADGSASQLPTFSTLQTLLDQPDEPITWRLGGVQPSGSRVVMAAQYKTGKTTVIRNVVGSLADVVPLFGAFAVTPLAGAIVVLDFEMSARQLKAWYRAGRICHADRVVLLSMRGRVSDFNILDPIVRRRWADRLRDCGASYLVVDCLRPILDALGLDEHREAGRLLVALDALLAEASIPDCLVAHHMGHSGERSRGDSRIRDWPDVEWQLVRKTEDAGSPRFFRAFGRDVDVAEGQLTWDADTRRLTLIGGSRKDAQVDKVLADVLDVLDRQSQPMSGRAIKTALADAHARDVIDDALRSGRTTGALQSEPGRQGAILYRKGQASGVSGECPTDGVSKCPVSFIETGHRTLESGSASVRTDGQGDVGRI